MWDPPRPGLEPASPALTGRLSTTAPPGKPVSAFLTLLSLPGPLNTDGFNRDERHAFSWNHPSLSQCLLNFNLHADHLWILSKCRICYRRSEVEPKTVHFFFRNYYYLFIIYFWLCWVFVSVRGLSLVVESRDHSSSRCAGFSLSRPLLLRSTGSRRAGSVVVAHGPSCSAACGIFPGLEPVFPALASGFSTPAPPGKPRLCISKKLLGDLEAAGPRITL